MGGGIATASCTLFLLL
ncbi:hypothetical protein DR864_08175 [Runella rosea]|uniref:Uncharacterized protein n=1 Tax=Runella rosea TaxID=2259595 RepID=A0A344TS38_9BACT|nr:hypothetical protein DR864_08175 [Runella rosea]